MINEQYAYQFCKEDISKIENYDKAIADTTQTWDCHHRTEIWWNCSMKDLIDNKCYYNRKACELIFLTKSEHQILHHKGKTLSDETKRRMSEAKKGLSTESKLKMSEAAKEKTISAETRRKMSEAHKNKTFSAEHRVKLSKAKKGKKHAPFTEEHRAKIAEARRKYWEEKKMKEV